MIDYMVIGLVVFFGVMGLVSGFLLQGLRVVVAVVSIWVTLTYSPMIVESVSIFQRSEMLRDYGLPILMFGVLYMLMALMVKLLLSMGGGKGPSALGRLFGMLAGGVLGLLLAYFIVSVGLSAEVTSGRKMVALSDGRSQFVELVRDHRPGSFIGPAERRQMEIRVKDAADAIREGVKEARSDVEAVVPDAPSARPAANQAPANAP